MEVFHVKLPADLIMRIAGMRSVDEAMIRTGEQFCERLIEANEKINLVSRAGDIGAEIERQFLLSLALLSRLPRRQTLRWLDIGSGGGFPAIPIAIFRPYDSFHLVESVAKKAFFLERTARALDLRNVRVINDRAEQYLASDRIPRDRYNWLSIKAVAGLKEAFAWGEAALVHRGTLVTFKPMTLGLDDLGEENPVVTHTRPGGRHAFGVERAFSGFALRGHSLVIVNRHRSTAPICPYGFSVRNVRTASQRGVPGFVSESART